MDYLGTRLMILNTGRYIDFFFNLSRFYNVYILQKWIGQKTFCLYMYIELELNEHSVPGHKTLCNGILCSALSTCIHIHEHGVHNVFYIYTFLYYFEF